MPSEAQPFFEVESIPATSQRVRALRIYGGHSQQSQEALAEETPIALVYNGITHAVMMATPADLEEFALGFSLTEGIIDQAGQLLDLELHPTATGISLDMRVTEACFQRLKSRRRNLTGRTGCGLCGSEALAVAIPTPPRVTDTSSVTAAALSAAFSCLHAAQPLNQCTGAAHGAALLQDNGLLLYEDVGRHNALDKLIGAMHSRHLPPGPVLLTSRASYELVAKAAVAGIPVLAAISAPTALAVELANNAGMTLIGFAREGRMTVFSHPQRVLIAEMDIKETKA